jgi:hypothetical protein
MCFNMAYGDPYNSTKSEDEEILSNDWFIKGLETIPPREEKEKEESAEFLPPFKENQSSPEYKACTNRRY